eukprot:TRINITY_DN4929_c0_g1_i1.p1 TRINITY_DN4929_c0_g1~~TRINITY_DN4929_c0_g1_i1.p1  ORF type:complete len:218 (-),score=23.65 TRINITY_DN4929_c0_g1_i1:37-690(-)
MSAPSLDNICKFLGTAKGVDRSLMFIQYASKSLGLLLANNPELSKRFLNLSGPVSDFRILMRFKGLFEMFQWIKYLEKHGAANNTILTLSRIENVINVIYFPLEHLYWLGAHEIIPLSKETINKIGLWSCRFWAAYVLVYFVHLWEDWKVAKKSLDKNNLRKEKRRILVELIINLSYFPMTLHWSVEKSPIPEISIGFLGTLASIFQINAAWKSVNS